MFVWKIFSKNVQSEKTLIENWNSSDEDFKLKDQKKFCFHMNQNSLLTFILKNNTSMEIWMVQKCSFLDWLRVFSQIWV